MEVRGDARTSFYPCESVDSAPHAVCAPGALAGSHLARRPICEIGHGVCMTLRLHGRVDLRSWCRLDVAMR